MSILGIDLYDVLVRAAKPGHYPCPNKGDVSEERVFVMIPTDAVHQAILAWIDGGRRRLSGRSLAELRAIAADPLRRHTLKGMPLFTENGRDRISYHRLYRVVRRAAERMDLFIDDEEYRETGRKRFVSFHFLRHEYVHRRLDTVYGMRTTVERDNEKKAIIRYMRWKGPGMLAWYSAHHEVKCADSAALSFNEAQDAALEPAATLPAEDFGSDEALSELLSSLS